MEVYEKENCSVFFFLPGKRKETIFIIKRGIVTDLTVTSLLKNEGQILCNGIFVGNVFTKQDKNTLLF